MSSSTTTVPNPLIKNKYGDLTYYNSTFNPLTNHSYILKDSNNNTVSSSFSIDSNSITFTNVLITYGGSITLSIYDTTNSSTIISDITIEVVDLSQGTTIIAPSPLYQNNPGILTYYNPTFTPISDHSYILKDVYNNIVSSTFTYNTYTIQFKNVIMPYGGYNTLTIYDETESQSIITDILIKVTSPDLTQGVVTTNPSPLLQKQAGTLIYTNPTFYPIIYHNYILKNSYNNTISDIFFVTSNDETQFILTNVIIPYGGINTLYILDLNTNQIVVPNIVLEVANVCFKEGTKILCYIDKKEIYVPIEDIKEDDYVKIYIGKRFQHTKHNYKKAKFIIKSELQNTEKNTINKLYRLSKEKNLLLKDDLYVTGAHAILYDFLNPDQLEKMQRLADYYNNYEIEIDSNYLTEEEKEKLGDLLKYYKDYRITMLDKYKLIAYYDLDFEPVQDDSIYNIYHLVIENDNKFGSYGIYANGILVESTDEAGLSRFSGYEKINMKYDPEDKEVKETIFDKITRKLNEKVIESTDLHVKKQKKYTFKNNIKRNKTQRL